MILSEQYVNFLIRTGLTQRQFLFLHLAVEGRKDLAILYKQRFPYDDTKDISEQNMLSPHEMRELVDRAFVEEIKEDKVVTGFKITDKFLKIYGKKDVLAGELLNKYPNFFHDQKGKRIPLKTMDLFKLTDLYHQAIMGSREEHDEILKDIDYAIVNRILNIGIEKFISSRYWQSIRKERLGEPDQVTGTNSNSRMSINIKK